MAAVLRATTRTPLPPNTVRAANVERAQKLRANVPQELREYDHFVLWRYEPDPKDPTRRTKVPYVASATGRLQHAASTKPATWRSWDAALAALERRADVDGVGYVVSADDPFTGGDLDHCRENGELTPHARAIIDSMNTYAEDSPSGNGVRFFVIGKKPAGAGCKNTPLGIEAYDTGRFFTLTGEHIEGTPSTIEERQQELDAFCAAYLPGEAKTPAAAPASTPRSVVTLDDAALLEKARRAKNGARFSALYDRGDTAGYASASEARMATLCDLAFWTNKDAAQMERLMRGSALDLSDWDRLAASEIQKACEVVTRGYNPDAHAPRMCTDLGNAERLIDLHGSNLRYCATLDQWYIWDGRYWRPDQTLEIERYAADVPRAMLREASDIEDNDDRAKLVKHAVASQGVSRIKAMVTLARHMAPITPDQMDTDPYLLCVENGVIDLHTGKLRPHNREDYITKIAPVAYDPDAPCPAWGAFVRRIAGGNDELIAYLQQAIGYSLTGDTSEQAVFFVHGRGANGKSVFLGVIEHLLGDYAKTTRPESLMATRRDGSAASPDLADLRGARFVPSYEPEEGSALAVALIKQMSGEDRRTARQLYKGNERYDPTDHIWIAANHLPVIRGGDEAIWRRIHRIPFNTVIPRGEQDTRLKKRMIASEGAGILAWAVRGALAWQHAKRLTPPAVVTEATRQYRDQSDDIHRFCEDRIVFDPDARLAYTDLWVAYDTWAKATGAYDAHMNMRALLVRIERIAESGGYAIPEQKSHGVRYRWGMRLACTDDHADDHAGDAGDAGDASCRNFHIENSIEKLLQSESPVTPASPAPPDCPPVTKNAAPADGGDSVPDAPAGMPRTAAASRAADVAILTVEVDTPPDRACYRCGERNWRPATDGGVACATCQSERVGGAS